MFSRAPGLRAQKKLKKNPCQLAKDFRVFSWERTHPACGELETLRTLEACAPRDDLCVLRVSAVKSVFGCGWAALCSSVVSFRDRYYSSGISSEMVR